MKTKTFLPKLSALLLSLADAPALPAADCGTTLDVTSRTEYYFSESDLLSQVVLNPVLLPITPLLSIGVGTFEILRGGTNCAALSNAGVTLTGHTPPGDAFTFDIASFLPWSGDAAVQFAEEGISLNGTAQLLIPSISPCEPRLVRSFVHFGGNVNVLALHAGSDAYPRKISTGKFSLCRDLVVQNNSGTPIEIPVSVSGEITVYGSFSVDTSRNYAKARLVLRGAIGGQSISLGDKLEATQLDPEPYVRTLNETRRVTIPSSPQPQTIRIDLQGEAECEAQAKGGGLFGFITASSAATASFPNSIDVGLPTGPGGGPLPTGVRVYDASDGSVYVDTTANPVPVVPVPSRTNNPPFAITQHHLDTNGLLHLVYPANTNDYYLAYWGQTVTTITNPFAMALGVNGAGEFVINPRMPVPHSAFFIPHSYFFLRQVPLAHPLDVDGDGFDDLTEYRNPALNPFVPNTVTTNPPPTGDTNSTSGRLFLWTANNHRYLPVAGTNGLTWPQADAAARAAGGHLATLTTAAENDFVFRLIDRPEYWQAAPPGPAPCCATGPWLGGVQAPGATEPAGGWGWVTAEPFDFAMWNPGEPNNNTAPTNSNRLHYFTSPASPRRANWNDAPETYRAPGYVIEFEPPATGGDCIPRDGLVAWWKGDGNALDSAGTNDGVLANGASFTPGIAGQAFMLDGSDDLVVMPDSPSFSFAQTMTVQAWINRQGNSLNSVIVSQYDSSIDQDSWSLQLRGQTPGVLEFAVQGPNFTAYSVSVRNLVIPQGRFTHVAASVALPSIRLYVNGAEVETQVHPASVNLSSFLESSSPIRIGGAVCEPGDLCVQFAGLIDDVLIYNRALTADEIAAIYRRGITGHCQPQCVPPPPGLVAWWPGEGNANDIVGGLVPSAMNSVNFVTAQVGQGLTFGTDGYIEVQHTPSLAGQRFTLEAWARPDGPGPNDDITGSVIIEKVYHNTHAYSLTWRAADSRFTLLCGAYPDLLVVSSRSFPTNHFYHVAGTYDGTAFRLFVNGELEGQLLYSGELTYNPAIPWSIGAAPANIRVQGFPRTWNGKLDEVKIYNRALTVDEIAGIYLAGSAGFCPKPDCAEPPTGLAAWWPGEGNANDLVGNHHGTLQNGATFAPGLAGQAFRFDGVDDSVQVPDSATLHPERFTIQTWVRFDALESPTSNLQYGDQYLLQKRNTRIAGDCGYCLSTFRQGNNHVFQFSLNSAAGGGVAVVSQTGFTTDRWYHLVATYDQQVARLYVDGVLDAQQPATFPPDYDSSPLVLGSSVRGNGDGRLQGNLDDVALFNRALTTAEIQALYQSAAAPPLGPVVDHGGADWTASPGEVLGGAHVNIGAFVIPAGVTGLVARFDGAGGGAVEIRARTIRVAGTLDATGQGYPGGGGGGGGGGGDQLREDGGRPGTGGTGGMGHFMSSPGSPGTDGFERRGGTGGSGGAGFAFTDGRPNFAGRGGGGAPGGENAGHNPVGTNGAPGGYSAPGTNGDLTVGDEVHPGFGGGGGGGGGGGHSRDVNSGGGGGGGGGSGGFGGGAIILRASQRLEVTGALLAQGTLGTNGAPGRPGQPYNMPNDPSPGGHGGHGANAGLISTNSLGGNGGAGACDTFGAQAPNCSGPGGRGGTGGAGAGGGILLRAPLVTVSGTLNNTGGGGATANGGTVKIFSTCGGQRNRGQIITGRLVEKGILMGPAAEIPSQQPTATVSYQSFDGASLALYPWRGQRVAVLTPESTLDARVMRRIVSRFDQAYSYYRSVTGLNPQPARVLDGLATIAVVPVTCGAGCGYLGFTGIELLPDSFHRLYTGVRDRNEFDQVVFYEFGRNFWFYSGSLEYKAPADGGSVVTGYAVLMRFLAMEAVGVAGGPFNGRLPFAEFRQGVEGLVDTYVATPNLNWQNTLATGQAPPNPMGLGGTDLFASFVLRLRRDYGGEAFIRRLWPAAASRPAASTTQQAVDNFVVAASMAAAQNLAGLFITQWRWPLSRAAQAELGVLFPP